MHEIISFCVNDVKRYYLGVKNVMTDMGDVADRVQERADALISRAERILHRIESVLGMMREDCRLAEEIKHHNEEVLHRLEVRLADLRKKERELKSELDRVEADYQWALKEKRRISDAEVPKTGDYERDRQAEQLHDSLLRDAQTEVYYAERARSQVLEKVQENQQKISDVQSCIEETRQTIWQLRDFLAETREQIRQTEEYRHNLLRDLGVLQEGLHRFRFDYAYCVRALNHCCDCADTAIQLGFRICDCLDREGTCSPHENCAITFADVDALGYMSAAMDRICRRYEDLEEEMRERMDNYGYVMQDAVIMQTVDLVSEMSNVCARNVSEISQWAQHCRNANEMLHSYYELFDKAEQI